MEIHITPLFIPLLFVLVYLEWKFSQYKKKKTYRIESSILNISLGIIERMFDVYYFALLYMLFSAVQQRFGWFDISMRNLTHWVFSFILLDFIIYWFHRAGHRVNVLWGGHCVHHQCTEFNITVAFRNGVFPHIFRTAPMLLMPLLGFPAEMIIATLTASGIWQMLIHTKLINRLGVLEVFMMTPSHHRVHHGANTEYIDKNFGGMFIVWDRWFGTFEPEVATVRFGITTEIKTWNPIRVYTHIWQDLYEAGKLQKTFTQKLKIWFETPDDFYQKYKNINSGAKETRRSKIPRKLITYIAYQIGILTIVLVVLLALNEFHSTVIQFALAGFLIASVINICLLLETYSNAFKLEKIRILSLFILPMLFKSWGLFFVVAVLVAISMVWLTIMKEKDVLPNKVY